MCKAAKIHIANMHEGKGKTRSQILDQFVAENGASILAVRPARAATRLALCRARCRTRAWLLLSIRSLSPCSAHARGSRPETTPRSRRYHDQIEKDLSKLE